LELLAIFAFIAGISNNVIATSAKYGISQARQQNKELFCSFSRRKTCLATWKTSRHVQQPAPTTREQSQCLQTPASSSAFPKSRKKLYQVFW
jgi:hypothetical protein